jgi:hypothetical protein
VEQVLSADPVIAPTIALIRGQHDQRIVPAPGFLKPDEQAGHLVVALPDRPI